MNEFFDRAQPQMDKLFSMSHLKADTRHHMKKVYSALTLTLLGATAGAMLANMMPLLANPLIVLGLSLYLIFSLGKFLKLYKLIYVKCHILLHAIKRILVS